MEQRLCVFLCFLLYFQFGECGRGIPKPLHPNKFISGRYGRPYSVHRHYGDDSEYPKAKESGEGSAGLPEPPLCGDPKRNLFRHRIAGGENANNGDYPWMAVLGYKGGRRITFRCGGSLVSSRHVLTAAHCIHNLENSLYLVRLGELDLPEEDEGPHPNDLLIERMFPHEEYNTDDFTNDIGLLLLEWEVEFNDLIQPICLPKSTALRAKSFQNYKALVAGWGVTTFGTRATRLQVLKLPVISNEECANVYPKGQFQRISAGSLCAGEPRGGRNTCDGDSGGPLMLPLLSNKVAKRNAIYQIGVVSYGENCTEEGFPGVYSRVTHFMPWIEKTISATQDQGLM